MPQVYAKLLVFLACLLPAGVLVSSGVTGTLGANPVEAVTHTTGDWTLRFLLLTLAVTPFRWVTGWNVVVRYRPMLGLFAFFYASLHFLTYTVFDHVFALDSILEDVTTRRYVTAGFLGFVLLIPLALTSTQAMIRRLGGRRWRALHRLVYVSAIAGVVHYLWLVKIDVRPPLAYAAILSLLLVARLWRHRANVEAAETTISRCQGRSGLEPKRKTVEVT